MIYKLDPAINLGTFSHQISVESLKITAVSFNFEDTYKDVGNGILSIVLTDPATGQILNIVYEDAAALALWHTLAPELTPMLFNKLIEDAKLPPGSLVDDEPDGTSLQSVKTDVLDGVQPDGSIRVTTKAHEPTPNPAE